MRLQCDIILPHSCDPQSSGGNIVCMGKCKLRPARVEGPATVDYWAVDRSNKWKCAILKELFNVAPLASMFRLRAITTICLTFGQLL